MNFRRDFLRRGRRTAVEPLNLVIIHIMQHHLSDTLRFVAVCVIYTKAGDLESI